VLLLHDLNKINSTADFIHKNPSSWNQVVRCGELDRHIWQNFYSCFAGESNL